MNNKPELHVVSISGGKDSTAMLCRMVEEKIHYDYAIFCDTGLEFPQMYEHLDLLDEWLGKRGKEKIIRLKQEHNFMWWATKYQRQRSTPIRDAIYLRYPEYNLPLTYGWANVHCRWCTDSLKAQPRRNFLRQFKKYNVIQYIGLAADEQYRLTRKKNINAFHRYPLADWQMTEANCLQYCYNLGFHWGGLYEIFKRVSCWCCPLQSLPHLRTLHEQFPDLWQKLKEIDKQMWNKFKMTYDVEDLEKRFALEKQWQAEGKSIRSREFYKALKITLGRA